MRIESIRLKNYKVFQDVLIEDIPELCLVVGANGSGKSTLFDVFSFLRDCLFSNVSQALDARGRFNEVVSRDHETETILIEIKYQMPLFGADRYVTYLLEIDQENGRPVVKRELLSCKSTNSSSDDLIHLLDFQNGSGYAINDDAINISNEEPKRENLTVDSPDILAIKGIGQFQRFKAATVFRQMIESWHVSNFSVDNALGRNEFIGNVEHLTSSGDNLSRVAFYLMRNYPDTFNKIVEQLKKCVPGLEKVTIELMPDGYLSMSFLDGAVKTPFFGRSVSDGTIKMLAYLILVYDPKPHPLLCVEEPENMLYFKLMTELAEEFRLYANRGGQVFVSTHSPDFLNAVDLEEVFWLVKKDGFTTIRRAKDDPQIAAYMADGDKMGYLWKQGFFAGADPL